MAETRPTVEVTEDWLTDQAVSLPVELYNDWEAAKAKHKAQQDVADTLKTDVDKAKAAIVAALNGAVAGDFGNGHGVTNRLEHREPYAVGARDSYVLRAVKTKAPQ